MKDNVQRRPDQSIKFKNLCNNLRHKGVKKTDAEIIDIAMVLLKNHFKLG